MIIATWNINGMQARLGFLRHWLQARTPDLVLLQELKLSADRFPHAELEEAGYQAVVHGQKSWNGVAILARAGAGALRPVTRGLPGLEQQGARLVGAELAAPGCEPLSCISVYVPNGRRVGHPEFAHKLPFLDGLAEFLRQELAGSRNLVAGGDFNLCPGPLDTWDEAAWAGKIFHTAAERERFAALAALGLTDLYRRLHPAGAQFSWWDYRAGNFHKNLGLRIDFLLASAAVAARTRAVWIDREYRKKKQGMIASDHAPVFAEVGPSPVAGDAVGGGG